MGVCIKGMKMPTIEMEWIIRHGADGKWYAIDTNAETSDGEWHEIIPVPPHGRLIDADVMFKDICNDINAMTAVGIAVDGQWLWDKLNNALENTPTIIAAEDGK